jgi:hypothetical protein
MLAAKMEVRRNKGLKEKATKLDDASDTWSASVGVEKPGEARSARSVC